MSLSFNGTSSVLTLSSGSLAALSATPITLACWVKPLTQNQGGVLALHSGGASSWWGLQADDQWGNGMCGFAGDGAATWKQSGQSLDTAAWQLLVFRFIDANNRRCYYKTTTGTLYTDNYNLTFSLDNLQVGRRTGSAGWYSGLLAWPAIWTASLSDSDVTALAGGAHPTTVQGSSLFEYWPLLTQASTQTGSKAGIVLTASNTTEDASNPSVSAPSSGNSASKTLQFVGS